MVSSVVALDRLSAVITVTPEYEGSDVPGATAELIEELIEEYPGIAKFADYLELLGATGGVYAHGRGADLGFYGFGGRVVASFEEGWFLDRDRYFLFGEILYPQTPDPEPVFLAFDVSAGQDAVHYRTEDDGPYRRCADSLGQFLLDLAAGHYPAYPHL